MSISAFRNLMEKPGCYLGATAVMALGIVLSSFAQCNRSRAQADQATPKTSVPVGKIGDFVIDDNFVQDGAKAFKQQNRVEGEGPPLIEAAAISSGLDEQIRLGVSLQLAKAKGITVSESEITRFVDSEVESALFQIKIQLMQGGAVKPDATDADIDAFLKKNNLPTLTERRAKVKDEVAQALSAQSIHVNYEARAAQKKLYDSIVTSETMNDAELKATFNSYQVKRILIKAGPGKDPNAVAEKALDALKQSKDSFETFVDRYSEDAAEPTKKLSETTITLTAQEVAADPMSRIKSLKPGETTEVIAIPAGAAIYKLVKIVPVIPKDFDKNKDTLRTNAAKDKASVDLKDMVDKADETAKIDWSSPGYHAFYDWAKSAKASAKLDQIARVKDLTDAEKEAADAADKDDSVGHKPALLARYLAVNAIYDAASPGDQKALAQRRIDSIVPLEQDSNDFDIKFELVDAYTDLKDAKNAVATLIATAQENTNLEDAGHRNYDIVFARLAKLKAANMISADDEKQLSEIQTKWKLDKAADDTAKADQAKQDAADRKKADDEAKKQEADQKKADAEAKKNAPKGPAKPGPTSLAPGANTGSTGTPGFGGTSGVVPNSKGK